MTSLIRFSVRCKSIINYTECKRFAGHSKWANIRHTKMQKDGEKSAALQMYIKKMKVAVAEGKSSKPEENIALARVIEQAKKNSLPMTSIKNFLEKLQKSKTAAQSVAVESRGPSGCVVLIHLLTDNVTFTRQTLNSHLKKTKFSPNDFATSGSFQHKGIVLTEVENRDIDKITDDAIEVGAEEADIVKEDEKEFIQFTCGASELTKVKKKLEDINYKILQAEVEYLPLSCVTLSEEEMELVGKLYDRLSNLEEVVGIYTNIL